jgi:hypothetical protein
MTNLKLEFLPSIVTRGACHEGPLRLMRTLSKRTPR